MQRGSNVVIAVVSLFLTATVVRAEPYSALGNAFSPETCSGWEATAACLKTSHLVHVVALDGSLVFAAGLYGIQHACQHDDHQVNVIFGYLIAPSRVVDVTVELPVSSPGVPVPKVGLLNHETGKFEPISLSPADYSQDTWVGLLPPLDPSFLQCGWVEIQAEITIPGSETCAEGRDVVVLPDVTLGPM